MARSKAPKPSSPEPAEPALSAPSSPSTTTSSSPPPSKKRKRPAPTVTELAVDLSAPEPPSKAALRRIKKGKPAAAPARSPSPNGSDSDSDAPATTAKAPVVRQHGIWIGNLPWTATAESLRTFLLAQTEIQDADITRVNMPAPTQADLAKVGSRPTKPLNKGFAYVDFATGQAQQMAIAASEKLMGGRKVLIKDARSYEGRPEKGEKGLAEGVLEGKKVGVEGGKTPGKRIFVGNLGFDCSEEELREHWEQCGKVASVFLATFEDSGKCKGYAWVTFGEVEGAAKAVRGWVEKEAAARDSDDSDEDEDGDGDGDGDVDMTTEEKGESGGEAGKENEEEENGSKKRKKAKKAKKPRKWFVNRFKARLMRVEFAEDPTTRYKKRYGKAPVRDTEGEGNGEEAAPYAKEAAPRRENGGGGGGGGGGGKFQGERKPWPERSGGARPFRTERKVDARTIKPGAALAGAPRLTGAIVEGKGKKTTF